MPMVFISNKIGIFESLSKSINIVSFDVPFPANYGGVIDVFYKLYWLKQAGVKIHLHCFHYGRAESIELAHLCETVHYYPRQTGLLANLSFLPYTVKSRQSKALEQNLLANDYPILFEVLHTCYLLKDKRFANRKKIYRHSNIEHHYYQALAAKERDFVKKIFLKIEAFKLKHFEGILHHANVILAVNQTDCDYFKQKYPQVESHYLPSFHSNKQINIKAGKGDYILFHGNLSIAENYDAAMWLIENVFSKIHFHVIIAGLNPPEFLKIKIAKHKHLQLMANVDAEDMQQLIANAQVHVLYTEQGTGLKLKLLNVLFQGRFIICNEAMLSGTGLKANDTFCIANEAELYFKTIKAMMTMSVDHQHIDQRSQQLSRFDNEKNAATLLSLI